MSSSAEELITSELLRALIRTNQERRTSTAQLTKMGWILVYEQWVLRSARVVAPRWFQKLDALVNTARDLGLAVVIVEVPPPEPPSVAAKPPKRRARKR